MAFRCCADQARCRGAGDKVRTGPWLDGVPCPFGGPLRVPCGQGLRRGGRVVQVLPLCFGRRELEEH